MQKQSRTSGRVSLGDGVYHEASGSTSSFWTDPVTKKECGPAVIKSIPKAPSPEYNADARRRAALKWRGEKESEVRERRASRTNESLEHLADRWLVSRKEAVANGQLKEKTIQADERRVRVVKRFFGAMPVEDIDTEMIREWLRALQSGKASLSGRPQAQKTRAELLDGLRQMIDYKLGEQRGGFNPCLGLAKGERPSQKRERQPQELSSKQIADFLYLTKEHCPAYLPLFTALAHTGMRIREALAVTWGDIDRQEKFLMVTTSKTKAAKGIVKTRPVVIGPALQSVFGPEARLKARWSSAEDFVFAAGPGRPKSYRNVRRALARVSELMGLERSLRSHDFRHSLAKNVRAHITNDEQKLAFCKSMGWADTTMYDRVYGQGDEAKEALAEVAADVLLRAGIGG